MGPRKDKGQVKTIKQKETKTKNKAPAKTYKNDSIKKDQLNQQ